MYSTLFLLWWGAAVMYVCLSLDGDVRTMAWMVIHSGSTRPLSSMRPMSWPPRSSDDERTSFNIHRAFFGRRGAGCDLRGVKKSAS